MNLEELRPVLAGYRAQVEPAWSPATAHPGYDGKAGDPAGQCGVTAAWLQRRLREDHGIKAMFCIGSVQTAASFGWRHCWLDVPDVWAPLSVNSRVVVDLTGDQYLGLKPVVCEMDGELARLHSVDYIAERRLTEDQVSNDPVASRLALLEEALS